MKIDISLVKNDPPRDLRKLEAMVHYMCHKCSDPAKLGATKLNKALWFSDCYSYLMNGTSITNAVYIKMPKGPVPKDIESVKSSLVEKDAIEIKQGLYFNYTQTQFHAKHKPDLTAFSADEISMVDEVLSHICDNHTATSISNLSHDIVWEAAAIGEEIPVYAFLASRVGTLSPSDLTWASEQIKNIGA